MTYTVSSGTLNSSIPYHTWLFIPFSIISPERKGLRNYKSFRNIPLCSCNCSVFGHESQRSQRLTEFRIGDALFHLPLT